MKRALPSCLTLASLALFGCSGGGGGGGGGAPIMDFAAASTPAPSGGGTGSASGGQTGAGQTGAGQTGTGQTGGGQTGGGRAGGGQTGGGQTGGGAPPAATGTGGAGGQTGQRARTISVNGQSIAIQVYAPSSYDPATPSPVLYVFHGQGGNPTDTVRNWRGVADDGGFIVVGTRSTGAQGGWSFQTDPPIVAAAIQDVDGAFNIDTGRRYAWGFSAGGHFIHTIALANSQFFAAYATSAGILTRDTVAQRLIPVSLHVGSDDPLNRSVRQTRQLLESRAHPVDFHEFTGGHTVLSAHRRQVWDDLKDERLP